jgi:flagellar hook assembly protein FlgD
VRYNVRADVYDVAGRLVRTVFEGHLPSGNHFFDWDGSTHAGRAAAGIYFMRVRVNGKGIGTAKIIRMP